MEDVFYSLSSSHTLRKAVIYHLPYPDRQVATLTEVRPRGDVYVRLFVVRSEKLVAVLLSEFQCSKLT